MSTINDTFTQTNGRLTPYTVILPPGYFTPENEAKRNAVNGNVPVLCSHEELLAAVWEGEPLHSRVELNRLVWGLRRRLDRGAAGALIENERALGYRLHSCS